MPKTIAVIDGNSLMHRAYHAIQTPMNSPDGTHTNAVFGFFQMFCKFAEETSPDAIICAFDEGKPDKRIADLPEYKAQRPHMDEELHEQFPVVKELLESMNVPIQTAPGWEGDDVLGTIASMDEKLGYKTLVITGDKDACQLASPLTSIVNTKKGISDVVVLDPDGVAEKYGVTPAQFPDYLGLMGDSSDNIPGVPGIGPKTATKLLQEYGSIEGIYEHIDELKGKQRQNLVENEDLAYLSRQIATIVCDLDFQIDLEGISFPSFDGNVVTESFMKYKLSSPLARVLRLSGSQPVSRGIQIDVGDMAGDPDSFIEKACKHDGYIGFAYSESAQGTIFGKSVKCAFSIPGEVLVLENEKAMLVLKELLEKGSIASLDIKDAAKLLCPPDNTEPELMMPWSLKSSRAFDVGLAAYLMNSSASAYTYEGLANRYLGGALEVPEDEDEALCLHAALLRQVAPILVEELEADGSDKVYFNIDFPLVAVLLQMERVGVEIDWQKLAEHGKNAADSLESLSQKIYDAAGEKFNIDSPKQLSHILFDVMGLTPIKKNSRGYSTDATVMRELAKTEDIASLVLQYREVSKIKSTYIDALPKMRSNDGRVHTSFHETVTATGRISSSDPNLQNIPTRTDFGKQIRSCFIPLNSGEVFLSADYSQIELRLLAHLSGDVGLIHAFNSGADFHAMTAARVFGCDVEDVTPQMRSRAKAVNFGIVYGQQAFGLAQTLDIPRAEAKEMIDRYYEAYPQVRKYLDGLVEDAKENGFAETMFGRKRRIPELKSRNRQQVGFGERTAMNHPLQGSAADIIKLAMIDVFKRMHEGEYRSKLLLQVHDELDFSVVEDEIDSLSAMVKEAMEGVVKLDVPLITDISVGANWAEAH